MTRKMLKRLEGRRAVIHTKDDQSLRGLVATVAADSLWFERGTAEYLGKAKQTGDELEGTAFVLLDNIAFGQEL